MRISSFLDKKNLFFTRMNSSEKCSEWKLLSSKTSAEVVICSLCLFSWFSQHVSNRKATKRKENEPVDSSVAIFVDQKRTREAIPWWQQSILSHGCSLYFFSMLSDNVQVASIISSVNAGLGKNSLIIGFFLSINLDSVPMLRGIPMPSFLPIAVSPVALHSHCSSIRRTRSSGCVMTMGKFSSGTMRVSIPQELFSLISQRRGVDSSQLMSRSSLTLTFQPMRCRDGHPMERDSHPRFRIVPHLLDSLSIWTTLSIVPNTAFIKSSKSLFKVQQTRPRWSPTLVSQDLLPIC